MKNYDVCVVGGCGHVGLPLALCFADKDLKVSVYDINQSAVDMVNNAEMPFMETGCDKILAERVGKNLHVTTDPQIIKEAKYVVIVIGTPVDEFLNPDRVIFKEFINGYYEYFADGQTLVLRSTVFPGTTDWLNSYLSERKKNINVAFCPERIAEGKAIEEIYKIGRAHV